VAVNPNHHPKNSVRGKLLNSGGF